MTLLDRGDRSLAQVATDLGVHPTVLRAWKRKARVEASGGGAHEGSLTTAELVRLRRRVRSLEEDCEIQKKTAVHSAGERTMAGVQRYDHEGGGNGSFSAWPLRLRAGEPMEAMETGTVAQ